MFSLIFVKITEIPRCDLFFLQNLSPLRSGKATLTVVGVDAPTKNLEFSANCQFFTSNTLSGPNYPHPSLNRTLSTPPPFCSSFTTATTQGCGWGIDFLIMLALGCCYCEFRFVFLCAKP
jgi:hypothetical protein